MTTHEILSVATQLILLGWLTYLQLNTGRLFKATKSVLHITAGIEGTWEPTADIKDANGNVTEKGELTCITEMFAAAEEDPEGAIITTRNAIHPNTMVVPACDRRSLVAVVILTVLQIALVANIFRIIW
jgi:hypothetical protein